VTFYGDLIVNGANNHPTSSFFFIRVATEK